MRLIRKHWFLISLLVLMALGTWFARPFESLSQQEWLKWSIVTVTMFLMSWPLSFEKLHRSATRPKAPLIAVGLNLVLIPLLMWPLAALVGAELGAGMLIAAATPSTLASAAVMTRYAGGDDSVAIMVTIITNGSCFLVMPLWIFLQTGNEIEPGKLVGTIYKLLFFVVIPIAAAQLLRNHQTSAQWATRNKPRLSLAALIGILAMVFLGAVSMGLRFDGRPSELLSLANISLAGLILVTIHTGVFGAGFFVSRVAGCAREEQIAVAFSGSQKTLMIGLSTAINLGVSIIPIVMYHALQLIVDSVFAQRLHERHVGDDPAA